MTRRDQLSRFILLLLLLLLLSRTSCTSRVWPACQVEDYMNDNDDCNGTIYFAANASCAFTYGNTSQQPSVQKMLEHARRRFVAALANKRRRVNKAAATAAVNETSFTMSLHCSVKPVMTIQVNITTSDDCLQYGVDESYELFVGKNGSIDAMQRRQQSASIIITAPTVYGAMHALQTLLQLLEYIYDIDSGEVLVVPITYIRDAPLYSHRGLLIDSSRHYLPVSLILENLNAMSMTKLNVLHWHLTDSESWPWASEQYVELARQGAYCETCVYTASNIHTVVSEAAMRGIRVVVEVDLPGHCQSIGASHPELLTECGVSGSRRSEPLDVSEPLVYHFVEAIYSEVNALVDDHMIHIGGDEVSLDCWNASSKVQQYMRAHNVSNEAQLWIDFELYLLNYTIKQLGKRPIVWQDMLDVATTIDTDTADLLPPETIIDVWKSWLPDSRSRATRQHDTIYSACWYLDHLDQDWRSFYDCDPRNFNGTIEQLQRIIGGHASMWGERVDERNFYQRVWPRAAVAAEKLWKGESAAAKATAYERLDWFRCLLLEQGFSASPIGPGSCEAKRLQRWQSLRGDESTSTSIKR
ncbi:hypothetical protein MPSEU_000259800 [Mayamaea pseudoterrestris]|nr:hypothetical protein MPSEU_000259800 [Mayamaea pseudoterrestris]